MISVFSQHRAIGLAKVALLGALAFLPLTYTTAIAPRDTISVMIVGDSISQGRQGDYTWRYRIWHGLWGMRWLSTSSDLSRACLWAAT